MVVKQRNRKILKKNFPIKVEKHSTKKQPNIKKSICSILKKVEKIEDETIYTLAGYQEGLYL